MNHATTIKIIIITAALAVSMLAAGISLPILQQHAYSGSNKETGAKYHTKSAW
jgi:hypothetical protein